MVTLRAEDEFEDTNIAWVVPGLMTGLMLDAALHGSEQYEVLWHGPGLLLYYQRTTCIYYHVNIGERSAQTLR